MNLTRDLGFRALNSVLTSQQNIKTLEKYVYCNTNNDDEYIDTIYDVIYSLKISKCLKQDIKSIIIKLHNHKHMWKDDIYNSYILEQEEEDQFISNPFEIEEGVLECKCGSKRTISFQRQTRSADEGSTTFAQCVECGTKWRHNN